MIEGSLYADRYHEAIKFALSALDLRQFSRT